MSEDKANFLWPHDENSKEQAGYEFANAQTEEYRKLWWDILTESLKSAPADVSQEKLERFKENPLRSELCKLIEAYTIVNSRTLEVEFDYNNGVDALIRFLITKSV